MEPAAPANQPAVPRPQAPSRPPAGATPNPALATPDAAAPGSLTRTGSRGSASLLRAQQRRERVATSRPGSPHTRSNGAVRAVQYAQGGTAAAPPERWAEAPAVQLFGEVRSPPDCAFQPPTRANSLNRLTHTMLRLAQEERASAPPSVADQSWVSAAEGRLHAREAALAESLLTVDGEWARLRKLADEIAEHEKQVAQREAAVRAVRQDFPPQLDTPAPAPLLHLRLRVCVSLSLTSGAARASAGRHRAPATGRVGSDSPRHVRGEGRRRGRGRGRAVISALRHAAWAARGCEPLDGGVSRRAPNAAAAELIFSSLAQRCPWKSRCDGLS